MTVIGELTIKFHDNGYIELDETRAKEIPIGQIYRAALILKKIGVFIEDEARIAIDLDDEEFS